MSTRTPDAEPATGATRLVLVAIDGSEASRRVAAFVNAFFREGEADLLAISVAEVGSPWIPAGVAYGGVYTWPSPAYPDPALTARLDESAQEEAERTAREAGVTGAEPVVRSGDPASEILREARERGVDLVVVGSNHKGLLDRILHGSVSDAVVREAVVPVLVVP